jgi:3-mercaptopyruvate sulfurtransferase SseA
MSLLAVPSALALLATVLAVQQQAPPQFPTDPQTGRAIGAHQMSPEDVQRALGTNKKVVIIDVRDRDQFAKETIKGAINIPIGELKGRLREFSKDTLLVFT